MDAMFEGLKLKKEMLYNFLRMELAYIFSIKDLSNVYPGEKNPMM